MAHYCTSHMCRRYALHDLCLMCANMLKIKAHWVDAGNCQQPDAIFWETPVLYTFKSDARCFRTVSDSLGQSLRYANSNTTTYSSLFGRCCQCSIFEPKGCDVDHICTMSMESGDPIDGGTCTSSDALLEDEQSFAIGAWVPGFGFRCGCFPESSFGAKIAVSNNTTRLI